MKNSKQKLLLVQPHSDDILFSCSYFLFSDKYDVEVLTVENNEKRIAEDKALFKFIGIPFHHLEVEFDDQSYYGYHKKYKTVNVEDSLFYLREYFGSSVLNNIELALAEFVNNFTKKNKGCVVVSPWGIGHPFHLFVRDTLEKYISVLWYYREFPHSYKKRSQHQVEEQKEKYELLFEKPIDDFFDVKYELFKKFYKTQKSMLWFEKGYIEKKLPEEIYIDKDNDLPF